MHSKDITDNNDDIIPVVHVPLLFIILYILCGVVSKTLYIVLYNII